MEEQTNIENATAATVDKKVATEKRSADPFIWGIFILLCLLSLIVTYEAASREVSRANIYAPLIKHGGFLLVGLGIAFCVQKIDYQRFIPWIPGFGILTVGLLGYVEFFGEIINGAQRHISLFGISVQPAEMAKLGVVLLLAWIMAKNQMSGGVKNRGIYLSLLVIGVFGFFIVRQGLTNSLLMMTVCGAMFIVCGTQWKKIGILLLCFMGVALLLFAVNTLVGDEEPQPVPVEMQNGGNVTIIEQGDEKAEQGRSGTWSARLRRHFDPQPLYEKPLKHEYMQEMFARMAQAHGGISGVGPGNSRECSRLPLAFSDYVYSIFIEDFGLLGGIFLLFVYLLLLFRAGNIARKCKRAFPALLVIGMAVMIVMQALFHMAINVGVFPVSGQPLPLISMGGTSIMIISLAFGIMLSVSRSARTESDKKADINAEMERLPESMQGINQGGV